MKGKNSILCLLWVFCASFAFVRISRAEDDPIKRLFDWLDTRREFTDEYSENRKIPPYDHTLYTLCLDALKHRAAVPSSAKYDDNPSTLRYPLEYVGKYASTQAAEDIVLQCVLNGISLDDSVRAYIFIVIRRSTLEKRDIHLSDDFLKYWSFRYDSKSYGWDAHEVLKKFPKIRYGTMFDKWIPAIVERTNKMEAELSKASSPESSVSFPYGTQVTAESHLFPAIEMIYLLQISTSSDDNMRGEKWARFVYEKCHQTPKWKAVMNAVHTRKWSFPEFGDSERMKYVMDQSTEEYLRNRYSSINETPPSLTLGMEKLALLVGVAISSAFLGFAWWKRRNSGRETRGSVRKLTEAPKIPGIGSGNRSPKIDPPDEK